MTLEQHIEEIVDIESESLQEITAESGTQTLEQQVKQYDAIAGKYESQLKAIDASVKHYKKLFKKANKYATKKTKQDAKKLKKLRAQFTKRGLDTNQVQQQIEQLHETRFKHMASYIIKHQSLEADAFDHYKANTSTGYMMKELVLKNFEYANDTEQQAFENYAKIAVDYHTQKKRRMFRNNPLVSFLEAWFDEPGICFGLTAGAATVVGLTGGLIMGSLTGGLVYAAIGAGVINGAGLTIVGIDDYQGRRAEIPKSEYKSVRQNTLNTLVSNTLEGDK